MLADQLDPVSRLWEYPALAGAMQPPLGKGGGKVLPGYLSAVEMAFPVEVNMSRAVDGGAFLQTSHLPEALHGPLPSSQWQVTVLCPVVDPAAVDIEPAFQANFPNWRPIRVLSDKLEPVSGLRKCPSLTGT